MTFTFKALHALGESIEGECLIANDGISVRHDLDGINGTFSRPNHKLFGQPYHNKILILNIAKRGVAIAWMLLK
jgi:predicted aconitase with swiveling domain